MKYAAVTHHFKGIAFGVASCSVLIVVGILIPKTSSAISTNPATLTSTDQQHITAANSWLASMTKTTTTVTTASTITPSQDYAPSYTGPVSGTLHLSGTTYPVVNPAVISISSPAPLADSYRGVVTGQVLETPTTGRWIIQAYKRTATGTVQEPVQALADGTTGDFSIDLSGIASSVQGEWMFGILDATSSYAQTGPLWPTSPVYQGLELEQFAVTDNVYYWSEQAAPADGTFYFDNSTTGNKLFRLVDSATNKVLAEYIKPTGLIRSFQFASSDPNYGTPLAQVSYVYDQGTALMAAIASHNDSQAALLASGLVQFETTGGAHDGGFVFAAPQLSPTYRDNYYRTGADAIALDALLYYLQAYPTDPNYATYKADAIRGLNFIQTTLSTSGATNGLYLGGYGNYSNTNPQTFDASAVISWASTEHNLDVWQTLMNASVILQDTSYRTQADTLRTAIDQKLYNATAQRFNQGINGGVPDTADPLDVNSWGAIYQQDTQQVAAAQTALTRLPAVFQVTQNGITGYEPEYDSPGYPGAIPTVWFEGSFGADLAEYRQGNETAYRTLLTSLTQGQQSDGSFQYATTADPTYSITTNEAVSGTAWYVLATDGRDLIWDTVLPAPVLSPAQTPPNTSLHVPTGIPPLISILASSMSGIVISMLIVRYWPRKNRAATTRATKKNAIL